ncbi:hypothetical protein H5T56_01655 [Candidatus Bipolaricaulota bacterium]|nr:hypothetical protein [Candidatus Bipolaricaulota bacterium]
MRKARPRPWLFRLGRDLCLGGAVGALLGLPFHDSAFGAAAGALIGLLLNLYFTLRTRP